MKKKANRSRRRGGYSWEGINYLQYEYTSPLHYSVRFEMINGKSGWFAVVESLIDENPVYFVWNQNKRKCLNKIKRWLDRAAESGLADRLHRQAYNIEPAFEDVMLSVRDGGAAYHVAETRNLQSVFRNGVVPNGEVNQDVLQASLVLDEMKPSHIPAFVSRAQAVYAYPDHGNDMVVDNARKNCALLGFKLAEDEQCWVADQGWGGFCLFDEMMEADPAAKQKHIKSIRREHGKLYWKHSCSLQAYMQDAENDMDEVLIFRTIPPNEIALLGVWDENGVFQPTPEFKTYVKPRLREIYRDILAKYHREN